MIGVNTLLRCIQAWTGTGLLIYNHGRFCLSGLDFVTGWAARGGGRRLRFRAEAQKAKLQELAKELWENYMKEARSRPRDALVELQKASSSLQVNFNVILGWTYFQTGNYCKFRLLSLFVL